MSINKIRKELYRCYCEQRDARDKASRRKAASKSLILIQKWKEAERK